MFKGVQNKFNRGEVDNRALVREDIERVHNSCSLMENFIPSRLGGMQYRPGLGEYLGGAGTSQSYMIPFVGAIDNTAIIEMYYNSGGYMRVWVNDALIDYTGISLTTTITNGLFTSNITGWTDDSGAGSTTAWKTGGYASLQGSGSTKAVLYQTFTSTETGEEHPIKIKIDRAPIKVQIGTSGVGSEDLFTGTLSPGIHVLVVTPSAALTVTFSNDKKYEALVDYISIDVGGIFTILTGVGYGDSDSIRYTQIGDIIYCTCDNRAQFQIERRGTKSWSLVEYRVNDGPFNIVNDTDISLTAGALDGDTTLTASDDYFASTDVGTLFKLVSASQTREASVSAENNGTSSIFVTGVGTTRNFILFISGTWSATVTLQRSTDDSTWEDVTTYTTNTIAYAYNDGLDNSLLYYRLHVKTGDYTSGSVELTLYYASGSIEGICRVTEYTSATVVNVQVLTDFGSVDSTRDWYRGEWSETDGYPTAIGSHEGRLWWGGNTKLWGSVSDAYTSFDTGIEGDSASIRKTIGFGPIDEIHWLSSGDRLVMGIVTNEIAVRSDAYGSVITPTNCNLKSGSNLGVADVAPVEVNGVIYFVQRTGKRMASINYSATNDRHVSIDITTLHRSICAAGVKRLAFTQQPETRIYTVMDDGTARVYTFDPIEEVAAWSRISTDGTIYDVAVLPSADDDRVYWIVLRNGSLYMEKMALESEAVGGDTSKHLDSFVSYTSPGTTITGLSHLEGETVTVWADGADRGTYTVSSGQITVGSSWTNVIVGLAHVADWVSSKISGYNPQGGSVLTRQKRIANTGLIMENYAPGVLQIGPSEALLKDLPLIEDGTDVSTSTVDNYDEVPFEFDGENETDPRIYMRATGPCTLLALTYDVLGTKNQTGT